MEETEILTVRIPADLKRRLEAEAEKRGKSLSEHLRECLEGLREEGGWWVRIPSDERFRTLLERRAKEESSTVGSMVHVWIHLGVAGKLRGMVTSW